MTDNTNQSKSGDGGMPYTPAMCRQIEEALLRYRMENNVKWDAYHLEIKEKIGLPITDTRLHSNDPRHMCVNGHMPNKMKLDLYAKFISTVYPELKFSESRENDYIAICRNFSRFTIGNDYIDDSKLSKASKDLHGKIFLSKLCQGESLPQNLFLSNIISFRQVGYTPFLLIYKFSTVLEVPEEQLSYFVKNLDSIERAQNHLNGLKGIFGAFKITNVQKGLLSPLPNNLGYHGILQTNDYLPNHALIQPSTNGDDISQGFVCKTLSDGRDAALGMHYVPTQKPLPIFEQIIADMGEPKI